MTEGIGLTNLVKRLAAAIRALRGHDPSGEDGIGRVEAATRASEEMFSQFANSSTDGLWVRDAATLNMECVSPAIGTIYGIAPERILGDVRRWMELIEPQDRDLARRHLDMAVDGETIVHEFRIRRPSDPRQRWIRNTDFPLRDEAGVVQRIGGIARDVTDAKHAAERLALLTHELQHRVRNVLALTRSIVIRSGAEDGPVADFVSQLIGRLDALARTQTLLSHAPDLAIDLESMLREELLAQTADEGRVSLTGPEVKLSAKAAEVLTLAIHELATNSIKYGALPEPDGRVAIAWTLEPHGDETWVQLRWTESGVHVLAPAPRHRGFGTELIEKRVAYELRGRGSLNFGPGGIECRIGFPSRAGSSVLQTILPSVETKGL